MRMGGGYGPGPRGRCWGTGGVAGAFGWCRGWTGPVGAWTAGTGGSAVRPTAPQSDGLIVILIHTHWPQWRAGHQHQRAAAIPPTWLVTIADSIGVVHLSCHTSTRFHLSALTATQGTLNRAAFLPRCARCGLLSGGDQRSWERATEGARGRRPWMSMSTVQRTLIESLCVDLCRAYCALISRSSIPASKVAH